MIPFRFDPERLAGPGGLVADLLAGGGAATRLFPEEVLDLERDAGPDGGGSSPLSSHDFVCADDAARERLTRALDGDGLVVTTGQQPQLFGGPLYVLYKALSAVREARAVEERTGRPCVAVFWVASDDHDWQEVASAGYLDREDRYQRIRLSAPPGREGWAVGPSPLGSDVATAVDEFLGSLEVREAGEPWSEILRRHYAPGQSFARAFTMVASTWMRDLPVAFLDSARPDVRRASLPLLRRVLERRAAVDEALRLGTERVRDAGYRPQLAYLEAALPVFRGGDRARYRLRGTGDALQTTSDGVSRAMPQILEELERQPEVFSPSAALRPVLESWLLPVAGTVLGPGELAYWAQLPPLFETLEVPMPSIRPRDSRRLIEPRIDRLLERTGLDADDLRDGGAAAADGVVERGRPRLVEEKLGRLENEAMRAFAALEEAVDEDLPGLRPSVGRARSDVSSAVATLRKALDRMTREREETTLEQVRRAAVNLYPEGTPQERTVSVWVYLSRYGDHFLEAARKAVLEDPPGGGEA